MGVNYENKLPVSEPSFLKIKFVLAHRGTQWGVEGNSRGVWDQDQRNGKGLTLTKLMYVLV